MENRVAYKKMCTCVHSTSSGHPYREFRVQFHDRTFQLSEVQDPRNRVGLLLLSPIRVNLTLQDLKKCGPNHINFQPFQSFKVSFISPCWVALLNLYFLYRIFFFNRSPTVFYITAYIDIYNTWHYNSKGLGTLHNNTREFFGKGVIKFKGPKI